MKINISTIIEAIEMADDNFTFFRFRNWKKCAAC